MKRNEDSIRELWDNIKYTTICIIGVPEGEKREKWYEKIIKAIITENFLNMGKEIVNQVQEAQKVPGRINPKEKHTETHSNQTDKNWDRDKILKATREKWHIIYKGIPIRLSADFSTKTLQARREWHDIFKVMKGKTLQQRILYPARLSFRIGEIKSFSDKQKLREFSTTKPALQ